MHLSKRVIKRASGTADKILNGERFMERNFIDGYTEWQSNPEIVGVNKLPQHATFMPYEILTRLKKPTDLLQAVLNF